MYTCSICGVNKNEEISFRLNQGQPICACCVHKFDDLLKSNDDDAFLDAYSYFFSFSEKAPLDPGTKATLDYYLNQERDKYNRILQSSISKKIPEFLEKSSEEIESLKAEIENLKTEKAEQEIREKQAREKAEREALLETLGLSMTLREYIPLSKVPRGYNKLGIHEEVASGGHYVYFENNFHAYPEISDEEFEQIKKAAEEKAALEKEKAAIIAQEEPSPEDTTPPSSPVIPAPESVKQEPETKKEQQKPLSFIFTGKYQNVESFAEALMKILAWITWIGGIIISISVANIEVPGYYSSHNEFNWGIFLLLIMIFFLAGASYWCMAELFGNLDTIKNILQNFRLDQVPERKDKTR